MKVRLSLATCGVLLTGLTTATPAVAECLLTGSLTNATVAGVLQSACSENGQSAAARPLWLPQRGADVYEYMISGRPEWAVTTAASSLPLALFCEQSADLNGVVVSTRDSVDMSYQGPPPTPITPYLGRPRAYGWGQLDLTALERALAIPQRGNASYHVDCGEVGSARWTAPYRVLPASPAGREIGLSIDDGADFTNSPDVKLNLGWRGLVDKVKVSNDGGFAPSKTRVLEIENSDPLSWRLVVLGSERLPKTVYVRFHGPGLGNGWDTVTYTDDIVLDTVKPEIVSASLGSAGAAVLAAKGRTLRVKARDNKSGIRSMQVSKGKPRKKAKVLKYRKTVSVARSGRLFVRVRDGAGNWSKWKGVA